MVAKTKTIVIKARKENVAIKRDDLVQLVMGYFGIDSNPQARCLLGAALAAKSGPNFSAQLTEEDWLLLFDLLSIGYAVNIMEVIRRSLKDTLNGLNNPTDPVEIEDRS